MKRFEVGMKPVEKSQTILSRYCYCPNVLPCHAPQGLGLLPLCLCMVSLISENDFFWQEALLPPERVKGYDNCVEYLSHLCVWPKQWLAHFLFPYDCLESKLVNTSPVWCGLKGTWLVKCFFLLQSLPTLQAYLKSQEYLKRPVIFIPSSWGTPC